MRHELQQVASGDEADGLAAFLHEHSRVVSQQGGHNPLHLFGHVHQGERRVHHALTCASIRLGSRKTRSSRLRSWIEPIMECTSVKGPRAVAVARARACHGKLRDVVLLKQVNGLAHRLVGWHCDQHGQLAVTSRHEIAHTGM